MDQHTTATTDVLVSGAGIAGPALAYWLRRHGFTPTVVERAPGPRPGGQAVDLRGAGRTVIERMGLMERARALCVEQHGLALVDRRGRATARIPVDLFGGEGIVSEIEILRGDLADLLREATDGVEYLWDDTVTALDQDADGVTVTFENAPARRFALVVGADGLHSAVRRLAFPADGSHYRPLGGYHAWFTVHDPALARTLDGWFQMYNAPGGLVAAARPGRLPGEVKASLGVRCAPLPYDRRDTAAQQRLLADRFAGAGWESDRLLAGMRTAEDFAFDSFGQIHLDRYSRGRIALLGDAGYSPSPLTGLGTSLALVGAYLLAGELAAAAGDFRTAFTRYEELMRPYVARAQELPPGGLNGYAPGSALTIRLRAASMRWMGRWPLRPLMAAQFAKAGDIALPDYPLPVRSA
ncbi:FAD-dependent monooxygenase [Streptomyces sp. CBMA156]|uniref:FAD-dependent monooxygenase n=1 Tax=Streptomyces sp. CBMA156 TaxID=1930280 RepID=UPI0016619D6D|nr:FAD-dependent monooxygenase [Streptomyces sp. CBMA156]MBD0672617.1 FAD-binding monooxygenase [Streptomyces sp. CBMA156]